MLLRIDPRASEPIYVQIVRQVRRAITAGEVTVGDRLPAARDLAQSLEVNMHTVLRAYTELRDDGVIDLRRGRGAVVLQPPAMAPAISEAISELLALARQHGIPLSELHHALDEGALHD